MNNENHADYPADILVVDDVSENIKLLRVLLTRAGYKVRPASNGSQALAAVNGKKPDLILLDIKMPGMDGFEVCQNLQNDDRTKDIPIIFVTASTDIKGLIKGFHLGAVDYINKPFHEEEVLARVATHLELSLMRHHLEELVTERTESLQKNEEKYRRLIEGLKDEYLFYTHGIDGVFTYISPSVKGVLGYSQSEFSTHYSEFLTNNPVNEKVKDYTELAIGGKPQPAYELEIYHKNGIALWLEVKEIPIYSKDADVVSIEGIAHDITAKKRSHEQVELALNGVITATGNLLAMRDPYTAGHMKRVANLSSAIAVEMGLSETCVKGIYMGAMIHDIGKISIPAEILTKPTRLTDLEYRMIKEHTSSGNEVLGEIAFPWPIAEIAHQHHERIDGSGYPRGLKGDEIILEAKIVAVADVVEAMASDRPYREGLGMDIALEEITKNRGTQFDEDVVDVCLALFKNKKFSFDNS